MFAMKRFLHGLSYRLSPGVLYRSRLSASQHSPLNRLFTLRAVLFPVGRLPDRRLREMSRVFRISVLVMQALVVLGAVAVYAEDVRTWTSSNGDYTVEARLLDFDGKKVKLKKEADGKVVSLDLAKLSIPDRVFVKKMAAELDGPGGGKPATKSANPFEDGVEEAGRNSADKSSADKNRAGRNSADKNRAGRSSAGKNSADTTATSDEPPESVEINLIGAREISMLGAETAWSTEPDPAPVGKLSFKPKPIVFPVGKRDARTILRGSEYFFSEQDPNKVLTVIQIRDQSREESSLVCVGDVKTGRSRSVQLPVKLTPYGLSPNGSRALFVQASKGANLSDDLRHLVIADTTAPKLPCVAVYEPFTVEESARRMNMDADIQWAAWADDEHVLVQSKRGNVILFDTTTASAVWTLDGSLIFRPVFSPGRKYLIVTDRRDNVCLLEALSGDVIGVMEFDAANRGVMKAAFSPDGRKIATVKNASFQIWNLETGEASPFFHTGSIAFGMPAWADDTYLVVNSTLIHTEQRIPVWKYKGMGNEYCFFGGYYWHNGRNGSGYVTVPLTIPHATLPKLANLSDEEKYCVRPGMKIKVRIDSAVPDRDKVKAHIEKIFKENELEWDDGAAITLAVKITAEKRETVSYSTFGRLGGTEISYTPYTYSVGFEKDGETLWKDETRTGSPSVSLDEIAQKSLQAVVNEKGKPDSDWYLSRKIPREVPGFKPGVSQVSLNGIRDVQNEEKPSR